TRPIQETFHLGHDVEFVLAAVADVEVEFAWLQVETIHHLDGVKASEFDHGIGAVTDQRAEEVACADDKRALGSSDHLEGPSLRAPAPAFGIERGVVMAMAIHPAQVERGHES